VYLPKHFAEERIEVLHEAIRRTELATLVTMGANGLFATHLPVLLDPSAGPFGTLYGHIARANPQWRDLASDTQALAIFLGPHTYISPRWYATKRETGRVVPTWNYLAVHAYGTVRTFDDPDQLRRHVEQLTDHHEGKRPDPWRVSDAPPDYVDGLLKGIVGLEFPIERIEGKWKMSQNRPEVDSLGTIAGLEAAGQPAARAVADIMRDLRDRHDSSGD
jgi:transcriptional regulator